MRNWRIPSLVVLAPWLLACALADPPDETRIPLPVAASVEVPSNELLRRVYCVGMAAGDDDFALRIWCRPGPDTDEQLALRLAALATCLEAPQSLPFRVADHPDERFLAILSQARAQLPQHLRSTLPGHLNDPDYKDGYSTALEAELQMKVEAEFERLGLFDQLRDAYDRQFSAGDSCAQRFSAWLANERLPTPPSQQWERAIDVCARLPDDLSRHIVFHLGVPGLDPARARVFEALSQNGEFRTCLVESLRTKPELARRILALDGTSPDQEYRGVRAETHRAWGEIGVPELIEAAIAADDIHQPLASFLGRCQYPSTSSESRP